MNGMTLSKIQLTEKDNMTILLANLENTSNETKKNIVFKIVLLDYKGEMRWLYYQRMHKS